MDFERDERRTGSTLEVDVVETERVLGEELDGSEGDGAGDDGVGGRDGGDDVSSHFWREREKKRSQ